MTSISMTPEMYLLRGYIPYEDYCSDDSEYINDDMEVVCKLLFSERDALTFAHAYIGRKVTGITNIAEKYQKYCELQQTMRDKSQAEADKLQTLDIEAEMVRRLGNIEDKIWQLTEKINNLGLKFLEFCANKATLEMKPVTNLQKRELLNATNRVTSTQETLARMNKELAVLKDPMLFAQLKERLRAEIQAGKLASIKLHIDAKRSYKTIPFKEYFCQHVMVSNEKSNVRWTLHRFSSDMSNDMPVEVIHFKPSSEDKDKLWNEFANLYVYKD